MSEITAESISFTGFQPSKTFADQELTGPFKELLCSLAKQYRKLDLENYDLDVELKELSDKWSYCNQQSLNNKALMEQIETAVELLKDAERRVFGK